ncbi:MAG: protein kinase domain-containing protein [Rubripirellula sp.]
MSQANSQSLLKGTVLTTGMLAGRRLWLGPALTALVVTVVGWWTYRVVERSVKSNLAIQLNTLLDADVAAMKFWLGEQEMDADRFAGDPLVRNSVEQLIDVARHPESESIAAELMISPAMKTLRARLSDWPDGFVIVDDQICVIARDQDTGLGAQDAVEEYRAILAPVFRGETILIPPMRSLIAIKDSQGIPQPGVPIMFIVAPIYDDNDKPIAALCLRSRPEGKFTEILGYTGETYAFNSSGVMITNSRFDDELKRIGLLSDNTTTQSILRVRIRDPGVNMVSGGRPTLRRPDQPLTAMASQAINGFDGVDVDGYRDYRGVPVVGAWKWLPEYNIGVATEVDVAEAFRPLYALRTAFSVLAGLLMATTAGLFGLTAYASKMAMKAEHAAIHAKRMGQYALDEKIGSGAMGEVYRAHHDMLHRPTAVKLLHVEKTNEHAIARFEREVQLTSQLTHPNTIAIYDYGRTEDGVFYYAMEYLEGITLEEMISRFGPMPESRVIYILQQLCGSLSEAHALDLIHRDIKPANIMLTRRGGMWDFVKLLDFGLVKPQDAGNTSTQVGALTGTPLYLSPEAIQHETLDARSDLYAVGAVGYFMLTGETVFTGPSLIALCAQHVQAKPKPPSERLGNAIDEDLEQILLNCLSKKPEDRPARAEALNQQLSNCRAAKDWSEVDATRWWETHLKSLTGVAFISNASGRMDASQSKTNPSIGETIVTRSSSP